MFLQLLIGFIEGIFIVTIVLVMIKISDFLKKIKQDKSKLIRKYMNENEIKEKIDLLKKSWEKYEKLRAEIRSENFSFLKNDAFSNSDKERDRYEYDLSQLREKLCEVRGE